MVAMADAITAGCRVAGLLAPVASFSRCVTCAASASGANVSPCRFCQSVRARPSQPSRSAISATGIARPTVGNVPSQNSTMDPALHLLAHFARLLRVEFVALEIPDIEDVECAFGIRGDFGVMDVQAKVVQRA